VLKGELPAYVRSMYPGRADRAAGLGFLSEGQKAYSPIVFAARTVIAGSVLNAIRYEAKGYLRCKFR
jgi:hypothetical protein